MPLSTIVTFLIWADPRQLAVNNILTLLALTLWHCDIWWRQNKIRIKKNCDTLRRSYPQRPHRCIIETRQLVVTSALTLWHLTFKWDQAIAVKRTICNWIPPWASTAVGFNSNPSPPRGKPRLNSNKTTQTKRTSKRQQLNFLWSSLKRSSSSKTIISQQQRCWQQEQGQCNRDKEKILKCFEFWQRFIETLPKISI